MNISPTKKKKQIPSIPLLKQRKAKRAYSKNLKKTNFNILPYPNPIQLKKKKRKPKKRKTLKAQRCYL